MEKRAKIEDMYFIQKMSLTEIAQHLNISVSYVSRILKNNDRYVLEKEDRKKQNFIKRRKIQKELIYKQKKEKARQRVIENQVLKQMHEQATREMSKGRKLGDEVLRKWCSLYQYDKEKGCYKFDTTKATKPIDFPLYIKT